MESLMSCEIMIVDSTNFLYRGYHAMAKANLRAPDGTPTGAITAFLSTLSKAFAATGAGMAVCVFDPPGGSDARKAISPSYKEGRPPTPDDLRVQMNIARELIPALGHPMLSVPGAEANDTIATLAKMCSDRGVKAVIASGDKDMMQSLDGNVGLWIPGDEAPRGPEASTDKFGVPPRLVPEALALIGDDVDGIRGADGIGPKTAAKLLLEHGSLHAVVEAAKAGKVKGKAGEAIVAASEWIFVSHDLARARLDVPVPTLEELSSVTMDVSKVSEFADRLSIRSLREVVASARRRPGV